MSLLAVISPSKDLDYKSDYKIKSNDIPRLWNYSEILVDLMKSKSKNSFKKLMNISSALADVNISRYENMSLSFTKENSRPAIYAFAGDVYRGIEANHLNNSDIDYIQQHARILSGLYGLLRPLDLIQPYRLEMGLALKINSKAKNLYQYWSEKITTLLLEDIISIQATHLIHLASEEYFQSLDANKITIPIIQIHFREYRNGRLSFLSYNAKKARGLMIKYMAQNKVKSLTQLKKFDLDNYTFNESQSKPNEFFFIR
ncbi:MAG: peroxide stress protein YaaA [Saprospiraceae bacterium]|nr:peroxide stress protein YaaA [Saprospiraceae bacterium]